MKVPLQQDKRNNDKCPSWIMELTTWIGTAWIKYWIWILIFVLVVTGIALRIYYWFLESEKNVIDWIRLVILFIFFCLICYSERGKFCFLCWSERGSENLVSIQDLKYPPFQPHLRVETFQHNNDNQEFIATIQQRNGMKNKIEGIFTRISDVHWYTPNPIIIWVVLQSLAFFGGYVLIWQLAGCGGRFWIPLIAGSFIKLPLIYVINSVFVKYSLILRWREELTTEIYKVCQKERKSEILKKALKAWYQMRRRTMDFLETEFSVLHYQLKIIVIFYGLRTITVVLDAIFFPLKDFCEDDVVQFWIFNLATWTMQFGYLIWIMYGESCLNDTYCRDIHYLTGKANEMSADIEDENFKICSCKADLLNYERKHSHLSKKRSFFFKLAAFSGLLVPVGQFIYKYHFQ